LVAKYNSLECRSIIITLLLTFETKIPEKDRGESLATLKNVGKEIIIQIILIIFKKISK
jgi:hypothetical protein